MLCKQMPRDMSNMFLVKSMNCHEQIFDKTSMFFYEQAFDEQSQDEVFARKPIDRQIMNRHIVKSCIRGQDFPSRFIEEQTKRSRHVRFED